MNKRFSTIYFLSAIALIVLVGIGLVFYSQKTQKEVDTVENLPVVTTNPSENGEEMGEEIENVEFMTDVDMNVDNWQTKETDFLTVKFPKEWYWLESDHGKNEGYSSIMVNNPEFDVNKYLYINMFSGAKYEIDFSNGSEVVISYYVWPTANSGSPRASLDSVLRLHDENPDLSKTCTETSHPEMKVLTVYCVFINEDGQEVQSYYVVGKEIGRVFTARTQSSNVLSRETLEKIALNAEPIEEYAD
ncbi:MAG: hypothetical protein KC736_04775 [Candidatus Moranbacteria bacterium]|nr:hypothetical protein [Candidatus Moranbacteria bacterium]